MMSETPQTVVRVTFLLGVSVLFAAAWQGDHAPGSRSRQAGHVAASTPTHNSLPDREPPGHDLPPGESRVMVLRHAESDTDPSSWEQTGSLPPWTASGTDLPPGEADTMMQRYIERDTDPDDWERAGHLPPWTAPGTDLPPGESTSLMISDGRRASAHVSGNQIHTLASPAESYPVSERAQANMQELHVVARRHLPPDITAGTYRVVDTIGRIGQITLVREDLRDNRPSSDRPIYESPLASGRRIYWIRIERPGTDRTLASNQPVSPRTEPTPPRRSTIGDSAALLTGSFSRTPPATAAATRWLDRAGRWMERAIELVRALPTESTDVRR